MRQSGATKRKIGVTYRQLSDGERVAAFLRDRYPERTAANVSADTKGHIPSKTVEKWLARLSAPSFGHTLWLINAYGPEFICACMGDDAPDWLTEAGRSQARARLDAQIAALEELRKEVA